MTNPGTPEVGQEKLLEVGLGNFRLAASIEKRLLAVAKTLGLKKSDAVRLAISRGLTLLEKE